MKSSNADAIIFIYNQNLVKAIGEIATSANESASGTENIAHKASDIMLRSRDVIDETTRVKESSDSLIHMVERFKV